MGPRSALAVLLALAALARAQPAAPPKGFGTPGLYCGICKAMAPHLAGHVAKMKHATRDAVVDHAANFCATSEFIKGAPAPVKQGCPKLLGNLTRHALSVVLRGEDPRYAGDDPDGNKTARRLCVDATKACDVEAFETTSSMDRALSGNQPSKPPPKQPIKPPTTKELMDLRKEMREDPNKVLFKPDALLEARRAALAANDKKRKQQEQRMEEKEKPLRDAQAAERRRRDAEKDAEEIARGLQEGVSVQVTGEGTAALGDPVGPDVGSGTSAAHPPRDEL